MLKQKRIAIMGTGNIAGIMAQTLKKMKNIKCCAVASRDLERAKMFAKRYGIKKAYGSYEEMVLDPKIDLVYIATPHSEHYRNMRICIENGKAVLCEKAFTANAMQAESILTYARERGVFVAEAMWVRYMPMIQTIRGILNSGIIGVPSMLTCNLGYHIVHKERLMQPELAGGALLDLGVYTLNFASMMFGTDVVRITSSCSKAPTGVDASDSITMTFRDGKMAVLNSTMLGISDRRGIIYGTKGYMEIDNINNCKVVTVYDKEYRVIKTIKAPKQITGYEYEVMACLNALERGWLECFEMPHVETLRIMHIMDDLRKAWGVVYPFETEYKEDSVIENIMMDQTEGVNQDEVSVAGETVVLNKNEVPVAGETVVLNKNEVPIAGETVVLNKNEVPVASETVVLSESVIPVAGETVVLSKNEVPVAGETVVLSKNEVPVAGETVVLSKVETTD